MEKIKHWLKRLVINKEYKKAVEMWGKKGDWEEMREIESFLKDCRVRIMDYSNCDEIPTTLGLKIGYGNKEFFFYERRSFGLNTGARQYDMEYDGSEIAVANKLKDNK